MNIYYNKIDKQKAIEKIKELANKLNLGLDMKKIKRIANGDEIALLISILENKLKERSN
jgi:hypothetical protein